MGRTGGGVLNTTAKSGTNTWRGTGSFQTQPQRDCRPDARLSFVRHLGPEHAGQQFDPVSQRLPWAYAANNSVGYSATTTLQQNTTIPITSIVNPFANGLIPVSGNSLGSVSGASSTIAFVDPNKTAPYVQQYSVDVQRELVGNLSVSLAYVGSKGARLTTAGNVNINQLDPKYLKPELVTAMTQNVANPSSATPKPAASPRAQRCRAISSCGRFPVRHGQHERV